MNQGLCNTCRRLSPARVIHREGKVFLEKLCPECGMTETLISSDAHRYDAKHALVSEFPNIGCKLGCRGCSIHRNPNLLFVDITNRCNLNCPICINNTPSMGFLFEPPIEYFQKIFDHFSKFDPPPSIQLFGGEPTVRKDLFEIIALARERGLSVRVVTNGMKLADEEYCRKLVKTRATILIAYDNANPETYRVHRGNARIVERKIQALDNIARIRGGKAVIMSMLAKGFNDQDVPELLDFCHSRRPHLRAVYFMPLAHTWDDEDIQIEAERITTEDIEQIIDESFPGDRVEFLPASFLGLAQDLMDVLGVKPLPFAGAHPNCESVYLLISDGERYRPLAHYLKGSIYPLAKDLIHSSRKCRAIKDAGGKVGKIRAWLMLFRILRRHVRLGRIFKGQGLGKAVHAAQFFAEFLFTRAKIRHAMARHTAAQDAFQIIVLPFEDNQNLETERLEMCPTGFAFWDPSDDKVKHIPTCAWSLYNTKVMKDIVSHYHGPETLKRLKVLEIKMEKMEKGE